MNYRKQWKSVPMTLLLCLTVAGVKVQAQSPLMGSRPVPGITLELDKGVFDESDFSMLTLTGYLSGRFQVSSAVRAVFEIPFAHIGSNNESPDTYSEISMGNPYIGISSASETAKTWIDLGFRLPLNSGKGWWLAAFTEWNRFGSFGENMASISLAIRNRVEAGPVAFRLDFNPIVVLPTKLGLETEMVLNYSGMAWGGTDNLELGAGVLGFAWISESGMNLGQRTMHQIGLGARYDLKKAVIGFNAGIPIDNESKELFNSILGFNVTVPIRSKD